jgi:hypothetical protein
MNLSNPKDEIAGEFKDFAGLKDEAAISIKATALSTSSGREAINDCKDHLKIDDRKFDAGDRLIDRIMINPIESKGKINRYNDFLELYQYAKNEAAGSAGYITALRMHLGLNTADKLCILYQPVGLTIDADQSQLPAGTVRYAVKESGRYYFYDPINKKFGKAGDTSCLGRYMELIKIRRTNAITAKYYSYEADVDTQAIIFPFQEIFTLLHDNDLAERNTFSVYSSIAEEKKDGALRIKHSLVMAPTGTGPKIFEGALKGVYANLAHLCPPHCKKVEVKMEI